MSLYAIGLRPQHFVYPIVWFSPPRGSLKPLHIGQQHAEAGPGPPQSGTRVSRSIDFALKKDKQAPTHLAFVPGILTGVPRVFGFRPRGFHLCLYTSGISPQKLDRVPHESRWYPHKFGLRSQQVPLSPSAFGLSP